MVRRSGDERDSVTPLFRPGCKSNQHKPVGQSNIHRAADDEDPWGVCARSEVIVEMAWERAAVEGDEDPVIRLRPPDQVRVRSAQRRSVGIPHLKNVDVKLLAACRPDDDQRQRPAQMLVKQVPERHESLSLIGPPLGGQPVAQLRQRRSAGAAARLGFDPVHLAVVTRHQGVNFLLILEVKGDNLVDMRQ